ncbi:ABC transporter substrate-binding protein [Candidatus Amarolinea aalborgensis]|uniref:ABC transporter substrate-binding protein n=1 Tax=Candidatus Amarolinea aalborgensis TaxID=2249329 RepID=UPI003BF9AACB
MRKLILLLFTLLLMAPALAGCATAPIQHSTAFMVSGSKEEYDAYQKLVDSFQTANPAYKVELRYVPDDADYLRRLAADFAAGAPADVMLLNYRRIAPFADEGALGAVGPYLAKSQVIKEGDFYQPALDAFRYKGELWCLPQNVSSLVIYYNKALFDAAGVAYPANDWTWADFVAAAKALTLDKNGDGVTDQYGVGIDPILYRLAPFIWQAGGELVDNPANPTRLSLDSPAARLAFQWFVDLQVKEKVVPDAAAEAAQDSQSRFLSGALGMYFNSRRSVPTMRTIKDFDWDVAPLPRGAQPASVLHSDGYCMAAKSKDKEAAWKFIEYANSVTGQEIVARTGRTVPSLRAVAESASFLDPAQKPVHSQVWLDAVPTLRTVPVMSNWPAIEDAASKEVERAFYGQASVEEAAAAASNLTQSLFKKSAP